MGILLAGAVALVVWKGGPPKPPASAVDAGADGQAASNGTSADAGDLADAGAPTLEDGGEPMGVSDAGTTLLDGEAPPQLAAEAP